VVLTRALAKGWHLGGGLSAPTPQTLNFCRRCSQKTHCCEIFDFSFCKEHKKQKFKDIRKMGFLQNL